MRAENPGFWCLPGARRLELQDRTRSEPNQGRARPTMAGHMLRSTGFLDAAGLPIVRGSRSIRQASPRPTGQGHVGWRCVEQVVPQPPSRSWPVSRGSKFVLKVLTRNRGSESAPCLQRVQTCDCCLQVEPSNPNKGSLMCCRGMSCKQQVCGVSCLHRTQTRLRCPNPGSGSTRQTPASCWPIPVGCLNCEPVFPSFPVTVSVSEAFHAGWS